MARRAAPHLSPEDSLISKIPESPWWAKIFVKFGFSTAMAIVFVWWMITSIEPKVERIDSMLHQHLEDARRSTALLERISNTLIQTCVDSRRDRQDTIEGCFGGIAK